MSDHQHEPRSAIALIAKATENVWYWPTMAILIWLLVVIGSAMLIIGAIFYGQCTIEPMIPIFCIINGSFWIIMSVFGTLMVGFLRRIFLI
jgi:hypothetical protein